MTPERWERIKEIYLAAMDLVDAAEREAYLDKACAQDSVLRQEVRTMIASADAADPFWSDGFVSSRPEASPGNATDSEDRGIFRGGLQLARYRVGDARRTLFWVVVGGDPERASRSEAGPEAMASPSLTQFLPGRGRKVWHLA